MQAVFGFDARRSLGGMVVEFDFSAFDGFFGKIARFVKTRRPKPRIEALPVRAGCLVCCRHDVLGAH